MKLAIIGASYLQLPLVKKAKEMGLEIHCFAWEEGAVCKELVDYFYPISITEKDKILDICESVKIDGICSIASDLAVITVNYVAEKLNLISNSSLYSEIMTNKYLMRLCFIENDIPSPKFFRITSEAIDNINLTYPVIVKPTDRSGSRGVEKVEDALLLSIAVNRSRKESFLNEVIVEEFIEGQEVSVESISWKGKHYILQITDKETTGAPHFVELAHHQPSSLSDNIQNRIKNIVYKALTALHIEYGASHSELKITSENDIKVIEIGARMGGDFIGSDLVYLSTGYDFVKAVINIALGDFITPVIKQNMHSGVYFLCKETEYIKKCIENAYLYKEIIQAEITDPALHEVSCSADRSGYFIYQSNKKFNRW